MALSLVPRTCSASAAVNRTSRPTTAAHKPFSHIKYRHQGIKAAATDVEVANKAAVIDEVEDIPEVLPSTEQVKSLLSTLCNETEIMELDLEVGSFQLKVRRSTQGGAAPTGYAPAAVAEVPPVLATPPAVGSTVQSMESPLTSYQSMDEATVASMDEGLIYVTAPKVGIFRRGKYAAGKRIGKGLAVNEGDAVKKGQPVGFIEQLGTYLPVEAPQAGEVVKFKVLDGGPVAYKDVVVELLPQFSPLV